MTENRKDAEKSDALKAGQPVVENPVSNEELEAAAARGVSDDLLVVEDGQTSDAESVPEKETVGVESADAVEVAEKQAEPAKTTVLDAVEKPAEQAKTTVLETSEKPVETDIEPVVLPVVDEGLVRPEPELAPAVVSQEKSERVNSFLDAPIAPEPRGNRGAGVAISFLATVVFALVYGGVLLLGLLVDYSPQAIFTDLLLQYAVSPGYIAAIVGFFLAMIVLVMFAGRAGWWFYVLGGFCVAVFVWGTTALGYAYSANLTGLTFTWNMSSIRAVIILPQVIAAAVVGREVAVWFGAWIGALGQKKKRLNAQDAAEYEATLEKLDQAFTN